ncbi:hypothetical protein Tco_0845491 [Tanacetum coccineum]
MDNPNITMEEYIWLEKDKALKRGQNFNWETARYGKTLYGIFDIHIRCMDPLIVSLQYYLSIIRHIGFSPHGVLILKALIPHIEYPLDTGYSKTPIRSLPPRAERHLWLRIAFNGDLLGAVPFYTSIRDSLRRLWHRLIAFSISERGQAPEKACRGEEAGAKMSGGHFVACLAEHLWLLTE